MIRQAFVIGCDECEMTSDGDRDEWIVDRALFDLAITADGWRTGLGGLHLCPECAVNEEVAIGHVGTGIGSAPLVEIAAGIDTPSYWLVVDGHHIQPEKGSWATRHEALDWWFYHGIEWLASRATAGEPTP